MAKKKRETITPEEMAVALEALQIQMTKTMEIFQAKHKALLFAGTLMSNCCHNLAQCEGRVLSKVQAEALKKSQEQWDQAVGS